MSATISLVSSVSFVSFVSNVRDFAFVPLVSSVLKLSPRTANIQPLNPFVKSLNQLFFLNFLESHSAYRSRRCHTVTQSHSHTVTGGGGCVTNVTKCDERETVDGFNELNGSDELNEFNGSNGSDGFNEFNGSNGLNGAAAANTACPAQEHLSHLSHLTQTTHPTQPTQIPEPPHIHDMFPDIKPQQSMTTRGK